MEIIIGRDAITSQLNIAVDGKETLWGQVGCVPHTVGLQHCKLTIDANGMRVENLDINNYTFVNGKGVESKSISRNDKIELGAGHYPFDWSAIDSFVTDICPLEQVWDEYNRQRMKFEIDEKRFGILRTATGLITMIAIVLSFTTGRHSHWYIVLYGIAILISVVFNIKAWKNASLIPQKRQQLKEQFEHDYVCPHCKRFLGNQSFQILTQNDHCPYCRTQFIL